MPLLIQTFAIPLSMALLAGAGCGFGIDSASKQDIDQRLAVMAPSSQVFPASPVLAPRAFAVGQWTQHRLIDEKGEPSLVTYKIVGEDGGAHWLEVAHETYSGKNVVKLLISVPDRTNLSTMEIRALKMKDGHGRISELEGSAIVSARASYQAAVNTLAVSWQGLPKESVKAIAGTFRDSFKARTDASWGMWRASSVTWMHPTVPITALVKSLGVDRATSMELVGFGDVGAVSEIP